MGNEDTLQKLYLEEIGRERARVKKKMFYALALLVFTYLSAIAIYHFVEQWDWLDTIYFTTSTITTVGYGDMVPKTHIGRMITIPLMLIGIAIGFYFIYVLQDYGKTHLEPFARHMEKIGNGKKRI